MRFLFTLLPCLFLSVLFHAQAPPCSGCPNPTEDPLPQCHAVCLSGSQLAAHIATRKPIAPPGMNEPHMNSHGTMAACLCFSQTGKVTDVSVISGPAMMQQSVVESVKDWTFRPIMGVGRRSGGCGILRIRIDMNESQVSTVIEK